MTLKSEQISGDIMLRWKTDQDGLFDANKTVVLTNAIAAGPDYQYVEFDLSDNPYWKDTVLSLVLYPAKNASDETGNVVRMDSIDIWKP